MPTVSQTNPAESPWDSTLPTPVLRTLTPTLIRELADSIGIHPTKKLGQNFVHDGGTVRRIAALAGVRTGESVLEIGPGLGSLTLALLERGARVTAIEIDRALAEALPETVHALAPENSGLYVRNLDALQVESWRQLQVPAPAPTRLVANLPYNVSVPLLLKAVQVLPSLQQATVMVQAEVAERMSAAPGSRVYGAPTVKLAWYGEAKLVGMVSRSVFWPVPNVDSALVQWVRGPYRGSELLRRLTFLLVDLAFGQRRKKIRTPLREWLGDGPAADTLLEAARIDAASRAETLTIDDYTRLATVALQIRGELPQLEERILALAGQATSGPIGTEGTSRRVLPTVCASAPGKVNVVLRSGAKGQDGYHQLATVFESLNLRETVRCTLASAPPKAASPPDLTSIVASVRTIAYLPDDSIDWAATEIMLDVPCENHLSVRAAELLADYAREQGIGKVAPVHIDVAKRIPIAGGMAGGSADAAATLVALNELWELGLSALDLEEQSRLLGADVPACLTGGICLGLGRGDHMTPITPGTRGDDAQSHWWVLAIPTEGLSTPAVFQEFDWAGGGRANVDEFPPQILQDVVGGPETTARVLENDLQAAALRIRPELAELGQGAMEAGALGWIVCGSGPTVAALAADQERARDIQLAFERRVAGDLKAIVTAWGPAQGAVIEQP